MRLLLITEKLDKNDEALGFFHSQLLDLASACNPLTVLVLEQRTHALPENVKVVSLGKEKGISRLGYLLNFYGAIFGNLGKYDAVYVNRNPQYIVLGGIIWKLLGKKIILGYNHQFVDWKLKWALFFADEVVSPSQQGFPIPTKKLVVIASSSLRDYLCPVA
jgi:hypothetical protein